MYNASDVSIVDSGSYYNGDNVEDVLQEVGAEIARVFSYKTNRPLESKADVSITIGITEGYGTIQSALDDLPIFLRHKYRINIPDGDYSSENIVVPSYITSDYCSDEGSAMHLTIMGNTATPANVKVGSITVWATVGMSDPYIRGLTLCKTSPYVDELYSLVLFETKGAQLYGIAFSPIEGTSLNDIIAYESTAKCKGIDVTNAGRAFMVKRGGYLNIFDITGTAYILFSNQGGKISISGNGASYAGSYCENLSEYDSQIIDVDNKKIINGFDINKIDARNNAILIMPLNQINNGATCDLSGYQLDGIAEGTGTPTIVDNDGKRFMKFDMANGQYLRISNHSRLQLASGFFMRFSIKMNTLADWSIRKGSDYGIYYVNSESRIYCRIMDSDGTTHAVFRNYTFQTGVVYDIYGYYDGTTLLIKLPNYTVGTGSDELSVTIRQSDSDLLINGSDINDGNGVSRIGDVEIADLIIYESVPTLFQYCGTNTFNYEYAPCAVSPVNPKIYNPLDITKTLSSSTPTNTNTPSGWIEVLVDGSTKYMPIYI